MNVSSVLTDDDAVSSTIGVVLMVAVAVVLASAVGIFALDLAEQTSKKTPSTPVEVVWSTDSGLQTVDITSIGGDPIQTKFVSVSLDGTTVWEGSPSDPTKIDTYDGKTWPSDRIQADDTLGLKEQSSSDMTEGETLIVIWNNGEKSQVLAESDVP